MQLLLPFSGSDGFEPGLWVLGSTAVEPFVEGGCLSWIAQHHLVSSVEEVKRCGLCCMERMMLHYGACKNALCNSLEMSSLIWPSSSIFLDVIVQRNATE